MGRFITQPAVRSGRAEDEFVAVLGRPQPALCGRAFWYEFPEDNLVIRYRSSRCRIATAGVGWYSSVALGPEGVQELCAFRPPAGDGRSHLVESFLPLCRGYTRSPWRGSVLTGDSQFGVVALTVLVPPGGEPAFFVDRREEDDCVLVCSSRRTADRFGSGTAARVILPGHIWRVCYRPAGQWKLKKYRVDLGCQTAAVESGTD